MRWAKKGSTKWKLRIILIVIPARRAVQMHVIWHAYQTILRHLCAFIYESGIMDTFSGYLRSMLSICMLYDVIIYINWLEVPRGALNQMMIDNKEQDIIKNSARGRKGYEWKLNINWLYSACPWKALVPLIIPVLKPVLEVCWHRRALVREGGPWLWRWKWSASSGGIIPSIYRFVFTEYPYLMCESCSIKGSTWSSSNARTDSKEWSFEGRGE